MLLRKTYNIEGWLENLKVNNIGLLTAPLVPIKRAFWNIISIASGISAAPAIGFWST